MKKTISISLAAMLWCSVAYGQQLPGDSLASDFRTLVRYLEQTHPDPYTAFGGKVFFHKEAYEIGQNLKKGATQEEFAATALAFLSTIGDGHTRVSGNVAASNSNLRLPLIARPAPGRMMVTELPQMHGELLGSRVVSVNGVTIEELARRIGRLTPVENEYGAYNTLSAGIALHRLTTQLIPGVDESVVVELEIAPGRTTTITLDYISPEEYAALPKAVQPQWEAIDESKYMSYSFLDKGRRAMYFRLASIGSREQFLYMKASGMAGMEGYLKDYYARFLKREMPTDIDDAIAAAPSLAATFRAMLTEMKQTEAPYLIIDLRNNGGGTTPIVYSTLYQLWGDRYFETDMGVQFYAMYSPLYAQKYGMTFDEFNAQRGGSIEPGEYSFDDDVPDTRPVVERRNDWLASSFGGDVEGVVADLDGHPVYTPRQVFVITNYATFSAAFHYAFYLWKMGATVVGVPSSQAPNAFMDGTPFELPYTDLKGVISSSAQLFLPSDDPRAKVFWPDIMLSPDDYRRYGFDRHAELLYLMDYLELDK